MLLVLFGACEGEERREPDMATAYYPLGIGVYQVYDVKEKHYQVVSDAVEEHYQLQTLIIDSFSSVEGHDTYVMQRSKRATPADSWELVDTWSVRREHNDVVVSEGNTDFVKLRSPLTEGLEWNGNTYNSIGVDEYVVRDLGHSFDVNGTVFAKTVTVEQERLEDAIVFRDERAEVYAAGVGLIYKEVIQLAYCTSDECLGLQKVDEGIEMRIAIVDYGRQ